MRFSVLLAFLWLAGAAFAGEVEDARKRWESSPHGAMLERIVPPGFAPARLPEPASEGAKLNLRYCVQCHHLANPAMHEPAKWPGIVQRMVRRMRGEGNMGSLMSEMMAGVQAPTEAEARVLVAYFQRHGQQPLDPKRVPAVNTPAGEAFRIACAQCHVLPDPARHAAKDWPAVVARMERHMEWMNRVVGSRPARGEPQLRVADINAFLARHARK